MLHNLITSCRVVLLQVAKIETEKMLIQMVETELDQRKQKGAYNAQFKGQSHFFGYAFCLNYHCSTFCLRRTVNIILYKMRS